MRTIKATCVDDALFQGINLLLADGQRSPSRNGEVVAMPFPVMTINENPMRRVLFSPQRDANPFFHLNEALWMLAGRNDITWLDQFVGNFSERFGEVDYDGARHQHGAYGFRWRNHFDVEGGGEVGRLPDQLDTVVKMLKENPDDRRVVIAMWDPIADLDRPLLKDVPCNTHIYPRIRSNDRPPKYQDGGASMSEPTDQLVLDLTVCCRSNDAIWGAHGANAVHFSILQEYLAARIGVGVGKLYQLSNNYHGYLDKMQPLVPYHEIDDLYQTTVFMRVGATTIVTHPAQFDHDLWIYFSDMWDCSKYTNKFFENVAVPLRASYALWRKKDRMQARATIMGKVGLLPCDWLASANQWFARHSNPSNKIVQLEGDQNVG